MLENIAYNWYESYNSDFFHHSWREFIDQDTYFTGIGGCFNSNFLRFLKMSGIMVHDTFWGLHYNAFTILNELNKAFDIDEKRSLYWDYIDKDRNHILLDALRHPFAYSNEYEFKNKDREVSKSLKYSIANSNSILISFALSEVWEQKIDDDWIIINRTPPNEVINDSRYTFRHRNMTVDECKKYINKITNLLLNINKNLNIVMMVIPIPLKTSYNNMHPKISDILTKSRLLVAIDEIVEQNNNIIYFPVYEIFQYFNNKNDLFQCDHRHLKADVIADIGKIFIKHFVYSKDFIKKVDNFTVKQVEV